MQPCTAQFTLSLFPRVKEGERHLTHMPVLGNDQVTALAKEHLPPQLFQCLGTSRLWPANATMVQAAQAIFLELSPSLLLLLLLVVHQLSLSVSVSVSHSPSLSVSRAEAGCTAVAASSALHPAIMSMAACASLLALSLSYTVHQGMYIILQQHNIYMGYI
jgi:hypothetical protein